VEGFCRKPPNLTYTPKIAAFSGGCASLLVVTGAAPHFGGKSPQEGSFGKRNLYARESSQFDVARFRGLYRILGWRIRWNECTFCGPTQEQYARAAGTTSLLAFVVGYDPTIFRQLISLSSKFKKELLRFFQVPYAPLSAFRWRWRSGFCCPNQVCHFRPAW